MEAAGLDSLREIPVAAIGPITAETARALGLTVAVEAEEFTIPGLMKAVVTWAAAPCRGAPGGSEVIGFTKLLCGKATVSQALREARGAAAPHPHLLQFTTADRPLVVWNMTAACNLRCAHCYNASGAADSSRELTTSEAENLLDDLARLGAPVLLFSGGEPLLRDDLFHLGAYAAARALRPVVSTNGTLLTPELATPPLARPASNTSASR